MSTDSDHPGEQETLRIIAEIPVHAVSRVTELEYLHRVSEVLRLFEIDATGDQTGLYFGSGGVQEQDQPLVFAILSLTARRFGRPEWV